MTAPWPLQRHLRTLVTARVVLVDHNRRVGSDMGESARPVIEKMLSDNGVEAKTVVWCAGMRASPLTAQLPVPRDRLGRVAVDEYLRVSGTPGVFAASDAAAAQMGGGHLSVMSCQQSRPMGATPATTSSAICSASQCCGCGSRGMSPFSTSARQERSTPKAGIGRWRPVVLRPKPPSRPSIPGGSIHRSAVTGLHCWPLPHPTC